MTTKLTNWLVATLVLILLKHLQICVLPNIDVFKRLTLVSSKARALVAKVPEKIESLCFLSSVSNNISESLSCTGAHVLQHCAGGARGGQAFKR